MQGGCWPYSPSPAGKGSRERTAFRTQAGPPSWAPGRERVGYSLGPGVSRLPLLHASGRQEERGGHGPLGGGVGRAGPRAPCPEEGGLAPQPPLRCEMKAERQGRPWGVRLLTRRVLRARVLQARSLDASDRPQQPCLAVGSAGGGLCSKTAAWPGVCPFFPRGWRVGGEAPGPGGSGLCLRRMEHKVSFSPLACPPPPAAGAEKEQVC